MAAKKSRKQRKYQIKHRKKLLASTAQSNKPDGEPEKSVSNDLPEENAQHTYFDDNDENVGAKDIINGISEESSKLAKKCTKRRHRKRARRVSTISNGKRHKGDGDAVGSSEEVVASDVEIAAPIKVASAEVAVAVATTETASINANVDAFAIEISSSNAAAAASAVEIVSRSSRKQKQKVQGDVQETKSILSADVKRYLIKLLAPTPAFMKLSILNHDWRRLCLEQAGRWSRSGLTVDVARFFSDNNPFVRTFVEGDGRNIAKSFHDDVRKLVRALVRLAEFNPNKAGSSNLKLANFTPSALGWFHTYSEDQLPQCPLILREKIRDLFLQHFNGTSTYIYCEPLLDSAMFINTVFHAQDKVTILDLGEITGGQRILQCTLPNLEELVWHNVDMDHLLKSEFPKLRSLSITAEAISVHGFQLLYKCPSVETLYTGLRVPDNPTRFDLDVLLRCYQSFWNSASSAEEEEAEGAETRKGGYQLTKLPKLTQLFSIMARCDIGFETLQFGQLNQALTRLCSLDSVMQALFMFNQPKYDCYKLSVDHLRMYLHAMPVVSLDYYLPQLMMGINDALCSIQSLALFIHCSFSATMPSSWVLDGRFKNSQSKLKRLTHFSLHIDSFCVFDDLDCHLPPCLTCISISVILPTIGASKSVSSLLAFIKRLANVNSYPDLEELHLQVWGVRCAESLLNQVADHLSDIRKLSVIAMPVDEQRDRLIDLVRHVASSCPRLVSLQLSADMTRLLVDEYGDLWKTNWRAAIVKLREECGIRNVCELGVGVLPVTYGWDKYVVAPCYPEVKEANFGLDASDEEENEKLGGQSDVDDSCSNDSFVVGSDEEDEEEGSEDEIDECDRMLEEETIRRHERYLRRKARQPSTSSEDAVEEHQEDEDGSDVEWETDYEDEEEDRDQHNNPFVDGEAEEVEPGMESSDQSDTEPEGDDMIDEEMLEVLVHEARFEVVNARPRRSVQTKKKIRIIESDSD
ncbi:unnamed protein product [Cylicocyclus nassatus]|uniref:Uncharacterized protein n=1 Tax=Cylicocyclus nassatus TaxID=53992 RepID=A0AA36H8F5_CYLNA|nr:unnamed protein product [Cylicocyclus nassatus]